MAAYIVSDSAPLNGLIAEIAQSANVRINIDESAIPVQENVRGVCEIRGFDPLFPANEGKMALFCSGMTNVKTIMGQLITCQEALP